MLTMSKTFDQIVYESTATEIIESLAESLMEQKPDHGTYSSLVGIDKAVSEVEFSEPIRKMYLKYHHRDGPKAVSVSGFLKKYMDIVKVGKFDMSIEQCIKMAVEIQKEGGEKFYGILLSTSAGKSTTGKKLTFNPLHPMIASEIMLEDGFINKQEQIWTLNVFVWKDSFNPKDQIRDAYDENNHIPDIANTLAAMSNKSLYTTKNTNIRAAIEDNKYVINYDQKRYHISNGKEVKDVDGGRRNWIVALQILNNGGIAYPYYGAVYTKNGIAWNLTPMMSANVSRPTEGNSKFENGGRICTKSGDSKTIKGVSALAHSNLTSPLNSNCFRIGSLSYAHQSMLAGLEILTGESLTGTPSVEKPLTFKEYVEENPKRKAKDYLIYMREFVSNAALRDEADIAEERLAETDLLEEMHYPDWAPNVNYVPGDIVLDDGTPRQLTREGWVDYIPPIDLAAINTDIPAPAPETAPRPWRQDLEYHQGAIAIRRGWVYRVAPGVEVAQQEPMEHSTDWERVRQIEPTIPQEVA